MIKKELNCFYSISKFPNHSEIKERLLEEISKAEFEHSFGPGAEVDITRGDWFKSEDWSRPWLQVIGEPLLKYLQPHYHELGYDTFYIKQLWFQQYQKLSGHGWHIHGCNFTNVYYVNLPKNSSKTEIIVPFNQKEIISVDVEEGDILTFPSFVIHRGPPNSSGEMKTILSFNVDIDYPDSQYGQNLLDRSNTIQ
jgi:hypothetical protein